MTQNQIAYWANKETARHNVETEKFNLSNLAETTRHNQVAEGIDLGRLNESIRHNKSTETETSRHNQATEGIDLGKLNESIRHNMASEGENHRHNIVGESETHRSNVANESLSAQRNAISAEQSQAATMNAATQARKAANDLQKIQNDYEVATTKNQIEKLRVEYENWYNTYKIALEQLGLQMKEEQYLSNLDWNHRSKTMDSLSTITAGLLRAIGSIK